MYTAEFEGVNSFLVEMSEILLKEASCRETRGLKCWELPYPVIIKINNPLSRWVTLPERKWNMFLPYIESLWLASGLNELEMLKAYLPRMSSFSDDGLYLRGGYGPRWRHYNGNSVDYCCSKSENKTTFKFNEIDQIEFIVRKFQEDPYTRQAIITINDPVKDCLDNDNNIKNTKDFPCTCLLQFIKNSITHRLDLTVYMRSNDFIWGTTAVNIFNYTFLQEYIAEILGLEVGCYYHIANNLHYYERHKWILESLHKIKNVEDDYFIYNKRFSNLEQFDSKVNTLQQWEYEVRCGRCNKIHFFNDDFFDDWAKVIGLKLLGRKTKFINPILNSLSEVYLNRL